MYWIYNNKKFSDPKDYYGFIYKITDDTGKIYIGKKAFTHRTKKKLSKVNRQLTGKRISIQYTDSGWKEYWGSSKPLLEYIDKQGLKGFRKEILKLCYDKASLAFWEVKYLIDYEVLFREDCWNGNISGKFFKGKIHQ
jgi:hypothetical protein